MEVEDVTQDVFLRAYWALRANRQAIQLRPWLYRIAHNRCIDQIRQAPRQPDAWEAELDGRTALHPAVQVERREDLAIVIADIRRLPRRQRTAVAMRELGGWSYRDIAERLQITVPAVKSLLLRARDGLQAPPTHGLSAGQMPSRDVRSPPSRPAAHQSGTPARAGLHGMRRVPCLPAPAWRGRRGASAFAPGVTLPNAPATAGKAERLLPDCLTQDRRSVKLSRLVSLAG